MGDNLAYPLTCHYITRDTCGIYATADVENNNNNNKKLKSKKNKNLDSKFGDGQPPYFGPRTAPMPCLNLQNGEREPPSRVLGLSSHLVWPENGLTIPKGKKINK